MKKITRKEQKEQTREELLTQAELLFAKKGILSTTTADIAKSIEVSHGTLFLHFATRDDLVLAVIDKFGARLADQIRHHFNVEMSLVDVLKAHLSVLSEFEDFYLRLISESHQLPVQIRSILYSMNAAVSYKMYEAAKPMIQDKKIKKMDQSTLFQVWMALLQYNILNRDLLSEKTPILKYNGEAILRLFLTLIKN